MISCHMVSPDTTGQTVASLPLGDGESPNFTSRPVCWTPLQWERGKVPPYSRVGMETDSFLGLCWFGWGCEHIFSPCGVQQKQRDCCLKVTMVISRLPLSDPLARERVGFVEAFFKKKKFYFLIGAKLLYNVVLVSAV